MEYTNMNGYRIPNLVSRQPMQSLGKYGEIRRKFLREYAPVLYDQMSLDGTLHQSLLAMEETVRDTMAQIEQRLMRETKEPDKKTHPIEWDQWRSGLKLQAEELVVPMLYEL